MNTPYEKWMEDRILRSTGHTELTVEVLEAYQLKHIRTAIETARKSRFYRGLFKDIYSEDILDFDTFRSLPFTTSIDLSSNPNDFLCVNADAISRIVTINTSGTTGKSKRIFFTDNDLNATIEFFHYGMLNLVKPGHRILILMPGSSPASIGQLLRKGLEDAGCEGIIYGPVYDIEDVLIRLKAEKIDCIVGIPIQVYYLAKRIQSDIKYSEINLKSILLSADYVPRSLCKTVSSTFGCPVFTHYGMSEMGYGGGVECSYLNGYHMRDVDLYTEIINPITGNPAEYGTFGEVVITTLGREGMPFIRYRTGDIARFLPNACSCNKVFKRMDYVTGRLADRYYLKDGSIISINILDEIMFSINQVLDYRAEIKAGENTLLRLSIKTDKENTTINPTEIKSIIKMDKYLSSVLEKNNIIVEVVDHIDKFEVSNGMIKRKLNYV